MDFFRVLFDLLLFFGGLFAVVVGAWVVVRVASVAYFKTREQHERRILEMRRQAEEPGGTDG